MCRHYSWTCANCGSSQSSIIRCPTSRLQPCLRILPARGPMPDHDSIFRCSQCKLFTDQDGSPAHDPRATRGLAYAAQAPSGLPQPPQPYWNTPDIAIDPRLLSQPSVSGIGPSQAPPLFPGLPPLSASPTLPNLHRLAPTATMPPPVIRIDTPARQEAPVETPGPSLRDAAARLESMQQTRSSLFSTLR